MIEAAFAKPGLFADDRQARALEAAFAEDLGEDGNDVRTFGDSTGEFTLAV